MIEPDESPEAAKAAGAVFYSLPKDLTDDMIDPLLRKAVRRINESGWCWTAESCQGHPDATELAPWGFNTKPMLRLVCHESGFGEMLAKLAHAMSDEHDALAGSCMFEVCNYKARGDYAEALIYVRAANVFERNRGCRAFERFAEMT